MSTHHKLGTRFLIVLVVSSVGVASVHAQQNAVTQPSAVTDEVPAGMLVEPVAISTVDKDASDGDQELPPPQMSIIDIQESSDASMEFDELPAPHPSTTKPWVGAKLDNSRPEILSVVPGSPAYFAGLVTGDLLVSVQAKAVGSTAEVIQRVSGQHPGTSLKLNLIRGGQRYSATLKLGSIYDRDLAKTANH